MRKLLRPTPRIPRVIAVVSMRSNCGPAILRGIFAHIADCGEWGLEIIRSATEFTARTVSAARAHRVRGFIIALNEKTPEADRALVESAIPFVTVENYSETLVRSPTAAHHIRIDNADIGRAAARSFLRQGRYLSFAFIPSHGDPPWSAARGDGFARALAGRGQHAEIFGGRSADAFTRRGELAKWLRRLEKPVAVLAADDSVALEVIQACQSVRLRIPDDVAVLGVDDDPMICENVHPAISSIRPPFMAAGQAAAEALESMMRRQGKPEKSKIRTIAGQSEIIARSSTSRESNAGILVQRAIAYIRANAKRGIRVEDVRAHLGVSRALLDLRFREVRGESVLDILTAARLKELKSSLRASDEPIADITFRLGWKSPNYPKNLFKRKFGCSMTAWRKSPQ